MRLAAKVLIVAACALAGAARAQLLNSQEQTELCGVLAVASQTMLSDNLPWERRPDRVFRSFELTPAMTVCGEQTYPTRDSGTLPAYSAIGFSEDRNHAEVVIGTMAGAQSAVAMHGYSCLFDRAGNGVEWHAAGCSAVQLIPAPAYAPVPNPIPVP